MKKNKIQAILPDALIEKFENQAKKQSRSHSNLARLYIVEGLLRDEAKAVPIVATINGEDLKFNLGRSGQ